MKDNEDLIIRKLDKQYHSVDNFKEQIALLYPVSNVGGDVLLLRTFAYVCDPGSASFDPDHPGADSAQAWDEMDSFIEKQGACGFFHTHPAFCSQWSSQDIRTQNGLAKANGDTMLWHGVQPVFNLHDRKHHSEFVCCWLNRGRVFRYIYRDFEDDLDNPIIRLKPVIHTEWHHDAYCISE